MSKVDVDSVEVTQAVSRDDALNFLNVAVRNWKLVNFNNDGLEDTRAALDRFVNKRIATQAAEIAQLKQELQLYLPPASISGDYGQGWVEGQAWMINCLRGEAAFDEAVPLTHALLEKHAEIARMVDMANVGAEIMSAIKDYSGHAAMKGWHPADCPSEIVGDLLNALDERDAEIARLREYEALFTALRDQSWDLRCFNMPSGGDDADVGWRVIGHWMAEPHERTVAEVYTDNPAAAVRAALSAQPSGDISFCNGDACRKKSMDMQKARPIAAIVQLRNHQRQLDQDGCFVGVSRQALDEVLRFIEEQKA